ncbi:unnamed protein product [Withania somnifera]
MASESGLEELNFVLIPLLAAIHIIPVVDMAKLLTQRGVTVTLVMTPLNAIRFTAVIDLAVGSGLLIRVLELQFPAKEAGLPEGCESVDVLPGVAYRRNSFIAVDMLQDQAEKSLAEMKSKPSCIISNMQSFFYGMSCFNQLCVHNLYIMKDKKNPESGPFVITDLPDRIEVTKAQLPGHFNPAPTLCAQDIWDKIRAAETRAYGVLIHTFEELEQWYVDKFGKLKDGRVWCIGPLSLCNNDNIDKAQRWNKDSCDKKECLKWLDSWQPESVVYACLGSRNHTTVVQFMELALGLYKIWGNTSTNRELDIGKWIRRKNKRKRVLIRGCAPQVLILSHPEIGGFLTHCVLNERFLVHVLKTGVSVGSHEVVHFGEEEKFEVQVRKEEITKAIRATMDKEKEGKEPKKLDKLQKKQ